MSKKNGKPNKRQGNPNRPRSKNNPDGARHDPPTNYKKYEQGRKNEAARYEKQMITIAGKIRRLLGIPPGTYDVRVCAVLCSIVKIRRDLSYRDLYTYLQENPEEARRCELARVYTKSWLHLRISELDPELLQTIITWMAGKDAYNDLIADSSGFSVKIYVEWKHAKYGSISVRRFVKMHILRAKGGKIVACTVTTGEEHDSPQLREMLKQLPEYTGMDITYVMGDKAYNAKKNCSAIKKTGRNPIMPPKHGYVLKGFNAWSEMLRHLEKHPRTYYAILRGRNGVENAFSVLKARFGGFVRAKSLKTQTIDLLAMSICYNILH